MTTKARKPDLPAGDPRHGTPTGYFNYSRCLPLNGKCPACRAAGSAYRTNPHPDRLAVILRALQLHSFNYDGECMGCGFVSDDPDASERHRAEAVEAALGRDPSLRRLDHRPSLEAAIKHAEAGEECEICEKFLTILEVERMPRRR